MTTIDKIKRHGTEGGYRSGCRCDDCTKANQEGTKRRREAAAEKRERAALIVKRGEIKAIAKSEPVAGEVCIVPDDLWAAYTKARDQRDRAAETMERIEMDVKERMGSAELLRTQSGKLVASWKLTTTHRFDLAAFKTAHPDLATTFTRASSFRRFSLFQPDRKPKRPTTTPTQHRRFQEAKP